MAIFHGYVSSPEGTRKNSMNAFLHQQVIKDGAGSWCNNPSDEGVDDWIVEMGRMRFPRKPWERAWETMETMVFTIKLIGLSG